MKKIITIGAVIGLLTAGTAFAFGYVQPLQIYKIFAEIPQEKVTIYKVVDKKATCYILVAPVVSGKSVAKNQSISCVK